MNVKLEEAIEKLKWPYIGNISVSALTLQKLEGISPDMCTCLTFLEGKYHLFYNCEWNLSEPTISSETLDDIIVWLAFMD